MVQKTEGSGFGKALISVLALLLSLCIGGQADALPVTWTVTRADDNPSIPAPGSFRHTVMFANHGDTIVFSGEAGTVVLADQVAIDKTLIITGPATIRQGAQHRRVLEVTATCTMHEITITDGNFTSPEFYLERLNGAGIRVSATGDLTMNSCKVFLNATGGGIENLGRLTMSSCILSHNSTSWPYGAALSNIRALGNDPAAVRATVTLNGCTIEDNAFKGGSGGGIYNEDILVMNNTIIRHNDGDTNRGGGLCLGPRSNTVLTNGCRVTGNNPAQVCKKTTQFFSPVFTHDDTCMIGDAPNRSATAFSGYTGGKEPEPRSIEGDTDVDDVKGALSDSGSDLFAAIRGALSSDLGRTLDGTSATLAGLTASIHYANTFEDVAVESQDLVVEYTASWPENARYYALFRKADGSGYEIPERGIQFEIKAGQSLPDGVTPPSFYVPGEGLMTWRHAVADNGSYDLNPTTGVVTFRVCSVRAAEATGDKSSGGGCDAATGAPLALLLGLPLVALVRRKAR